MNKDEEIQKVTLGTNEALRVTADGEFIWHPEADAMIEEGDFTSSPAMRHILRALRKALAAPVQEPDHGNELTIAYMSGLHDGKQKRAWVGLTDEEENALIPDPDGSAEANVRRVEVLPGAWGKEYEEVDAWSKPLVLKTLRDHEAKLKELNT
jgi:hypothetical protein